jgi:hypothetical protein
VQLDFVTRIHYDAPVIIILGETNCCERPAEAKMSARQKTFLKSKSNPISGSEPHIILVISFILLIHF